MNLQYYFRSPSIEAIQKNYFKPPEEEPIFIISEKIPDKKLNKSYLRKNVMKEDYSELIKDSNLIGKFNAIHP